MREKKISMGKSVNIMEDVIFPIRPFTGGELLLIAIFMVSSLHRTGRRLVDLQGCKGTMMLFYKKKTKQINKQALSATQRDNLQKP